MPAWHMGCGVCTSAALYLPSPTTFGPRRDEGFDDVARQLTGYLAGARRGFELALAPVGEPLQLAPTLWGA